MAADKNKSKSRDNYGPFSVSYEFRRIESDFLDEEYTDRVINTQLRQLDPLKEDLSEWINRTLGIDYINRENFLLDLDNGVVLCHLAQVIQEKATLAIQAGYTKDPAPSIRGKCFERAMRRSFFSRDNMENFIKFCRSLGVHENLLFESDDLVLHNQPRNVILCLLEVARLAAKFGIEPPGLVQFEKEIAEEEHGHSADSGLSSLLSWQFQTISSRTMDDTDIKTRTSGNIVRNIKNRRSLDAKILSSTNIETNGSGDGFIDVTARTVNVTTDSFSEYTGDTTSKCSGEGPNNVVKAHQHDGSGDTFTELDWKVQEATKGIQKNCSCLSSKCSRLTVKKIGEGKYNIGGRNVFVRLLKGKHTMVRVGGGWDTLEHFLLRHDPCQVKFIVKDFKDVPEKHQNIPKCINLGSKYHSVPPREPLPR